MEMSIKEKVLIGVIASTIVLAVGGSVWALVTPNNDKVKNNDETSLEEPTATEPSKEEELNKESTTSKSSKGTTTTQESNTDSTSESMPSHSQTSSNPSSPQARKQPVAPSSSPRTTQRQPQKVSCNESMKTSYTSLYNSQISAENARWASQVNGFNNQATGNGGSFSGGAQDKMNQYKPAHDAKIASINNTYQSNLASINCQ